MTSFLRPVSVVLAAAFGAIALPAHADTLPNSNLQPSVWLDAGTLLLNDGDSVQSWNDRSGNFRDATQSTSARRPIFHTGVANGLPVVRFNREVQPGGSANQFLAFPGILANDSASLLSLYVVAFDSGTRSATNRATVVNTRTNGTFANGFLFGYGTTPTIADYAHVGHAVVSGGSGTLQLANFGESDFNLLTLTRNGLASTLGAFTDVDATSNTVTWNGFTASTLNNNTQIGTEGGQHYLFGDIAEIIAFDGAALTPEEHDQVVRYLGGKYDILVAVPEPSASVFAAMMTAAGLLVRRRSGKRA